jgi:hypothetical protein
LRVIDVLRSVPMHPDVEQRISLPTPLVITTAITFHALRR